MNLTLLNTLNIKIHMRIFRTIIAGFFLVQINLSYQSNPSIRTSVDIDIVKQAKDVYFNAILDVINNLTIPDISSD